MNKQELLKQADYTFQRGNRELAKKYLAQIFAEYPNDEAAWLLLSRVVEEKEKKIECLQRVIKINPNNNEARLALARLTQITVKIVRQAPPSPYKNLLRGLAGITVVVLLFGSTVLVLARSNPNSRMSQFIIPATPTAYTESLAEDIATNTRAAVGAKYPEYAALMDTLLSLAVRNADSGMDGAPDRPGAVIIPSDDAGNKVRADFEKALPQPGSLSSVTLSEQQVTSWLKLELENNPDLPLTDIQVYLRDGTVQIWGMVQGSSNSTSALITGTITIDSDGKPALDIESVQFGTQTIPDVLVTQSEKWINQVLSEKIDEQAPGLQLMNINISSGLITISGMR
jgi:tetratricopeptide (TPR) repeat protein